MNEETRRRYLAVMSIERWVARDSALLRPDCTSGLPAAVDISLLDWTSLEHEVASCQRCGLYAGRTQTVFGTGARDASWLFVGEAPGAEEDRKGEPFVGRAGQLLNAMLFALGLKRDDVYIANVLKCRPPGNRDPADTEVHTCEPFLARQIELVAPQIVVAMGRFAARCLLGSDQSLRHLRGKILTYRGRPLVVTYHPAYLLRNPVDKRKAWEDLTLARSVVEAS